MPTPVSDARSNPNDQIAHAATVLRRSARLQKMFEAICRGGKKAKTVSQLMRTTGFGQITVLQLAGRLADQQLITKVKSNGRTAYEKDRFYSANRAKIIGLATNPAKLKSLPTKINPRGASGGMTIKLLGATFQIAEVTCDNFKQFSKARRHKAARSKPISEARFKKGVAKLLGETGKFQDWGGEKNDLYTSRLVFNGKRRSVAFAFKGPGTKGELTPRKMGKNGDQIQRLFESPAEIFVVQYWSQINQSVIAQMKEFAKTKSISDGRRVWYGVIDGADTNRLVAAYPRAFS